MLPIPPPSNRLELPPPPPLPRQGYCPLWNGQGVNECLFFILEGGIHWYGIHFIDGRAQPCLFGAGACKPCLAGWLPRVTGFVSAMKATTGGRYILRITSYAYRGCTSLILKRDLRGFPLYVARRGEGKQAPWILRPACQPRASTSLPPAVDTIHVLSLMWGVDLRRLAAAPPPDGDVSPMLHPYSGRRERGGK